MKTFNLFAILRILTFTILATIMFLGLSELNPGLFKLLACVQIASLCGIYLYAFLLVKATGHTEGSLGICLVCVATIVIASLVLGSLLRSFYLTIPGANRVMPLGEFMGRFGMLAIAILAIGLGVGVWTERAKIELLCESARMRGFEWVCILIGSGFLIAISDVVAKGLK